MEGLFTVIPVDGDATNLSDHDTLCLLYKNLSWQEAVELCRLSFAQGYECIIWKCEYTEDS